MFIPLKCMCNSYKKFICGFARCSAIQPVPLGFRHKYMLNIYTLHSSVLQSSSL